MLSTGFTIQFKLSATGGWKNSSHYQELEIIGVVATNRFEESELLDLAKFVLSKTWEALVLKIPSILISWKSLEWSFGHFQDLGVIEIFKTSHFQDFGGIDFFENVVSKTLKGLVGKNP